MATGAALCAEQFKAKALASGEEFSKAKFYLTEAVALGIGIYSYWTGGVLLSNTDLIVQVGFYGGAIVALETGLKIVFRWIAQSPFFVHALGGVPANKADTVAAVNTPAAAGGILITPTTSQDPVMKMPEANFRWMTFKHSSEDALYMKSQVMAAEAAGMDLYYVSYKDGNGGEYVIERGEVYGGYPGGIDFKIAPQGVVPAPGARVFSTPTVVSPGAVTPV